MKYIFYLAIFLFAANGGNSFKDLADTYCAVSDGVNEITNAAISVVATSLDAEMAQSPQTSPETTPNLPQEEPVSWEAEYHQYPASF